MSDPNAKATKEQDLARIRENQRRSRARRKDYIRELEAKIRSYEQKGSEASVEVQNAARKVLEENRTLRAMLRAKGVPDQEITAAVNQSSAAPVLRSMLGRTGPLPGESENESKHHLWPDAVPSISPQPEVHLAPAPAPDQRAFTRTTTEIYNSPSTATRNPSIMEPVPYNVPNVTSTTNIGAENSAVYHAPSEETLNNVWVQPPRARCAKDPNSTSCVSAAQIIRTMRSDVGPELEADLGCRSPDEDCRVANPVVFDAIEKYSNQSI
jgi:hypothetical protein